MERFQNTTRQTAMLPRIPTSVVIPSNIPMIRTMPDMAILADEVKFRLVRPLGQIDVFRSLELFQFKR